MDATPTLLGSGGPPLRFHLAVQRSRMVVYTVGWAAGLAADLAGVLHADRAQGVALITVAYLSGLLFTLAYRRGLDRRLGVDLAPAWLGLDVLLTSWGVALTGGSSSPWFVWYLATGSAAAFVAGSRSTWSVMLGSTLAYLGALAGRGDLGRADGTLLLALCRMGFLWMSSFYFLRAVAKLRESQLQLRQLRADERLKVEELIRLTQDLDQGTRALSEANSQIREADRVKSQFLANMSHELRTPLNSIIGFSEILMDRLQTQVTAKQLKFLQNIHGSGQHLLSIINDILDLSKVEAGKMEIHPEEFALRPVIEGVLGVMHGTAARRSIGFEVACPQDLRLETDPGKFKQVLYNLLSNAVKFSPEGARVRVVACEVPDDASRPGQPAVAVSVIDQGIGIAPADQEVIFQEFRQADGTATRQFGGTGLGLALVKKFTELQGGRVAVESELGHGSTFTVTFPRLAPPVAAEEPFDQETQPTLPGAQRVLVVEDDIEAYQAVARALSAEGYFPIRARRGQEALEMARLLRPTAITLDLVLPDVSGWEVLKQLKADPATRDVPVVIVSLMENRELGVSLGAADYFVKPIDRTALAARIRELAPASDRRLARVLLVDDDASVHELLEAALQNGGYLLDHAHSGREGLDAAERQPPDVVVLDLMMPDVTGFEVAAALRERESTARVPIVVLTSKDLTREDRARLKGKISGLVQKGQGAARQLVAAIRELEKHPAARAGR